MPNKESFVLKLTKESLNFFVVIITFRRVEKIVVFSIHVSFYVIKFNIVRQRVGIGKNQEADVIAWFGLSFERGIEWRDRFHGYVSIRTTFPFWTGKVLAGKLWQDLLLESKALFKPVSYLEEATNKGIDPGRISNAVNYAAKNMIRYLDMVKTIEKLELCSHLVKCKDIVKICSDLLFISPEKRISFGGSKQHDVILYLYACKVYLDEVNKVLTSERAGIPFGFKLVAETEKGVTNNRVLKGVAWCVVRMGRVSTCERARCRDVKEGNEKYAAYTYACTHRGNFKPQGSGIKNSKSFKKKCPAKVHASLDRETKKIVIRTHVTEHYHQIVFRFLKEENPCMENTATFMVDKDMDVFDCLENAFPHATVELCPFHVQKAFRSNWTQFSRKERLNFGNRTNNRIESFHQKTKSEIQKNSPLNIMFRNLLLVVETLESEVGKRLIHGAMRHPVAERYPEIREKITPFAYASVIKNLNLSEKLQCVNVEGDVDILKDDHNRTFNAHVDACTCSTFLCKRLTCSHILRARNEFSIDAASVSIFSDAGRKLTRVKRFKAAKH
ncbi:hypothetical protein CAPTEDRAFT_185833 [Capitella teleta]|uniref:SWIM-type domain-containing protein n=1 Tax=Capitella teleta TaxID=283909 RepID=R7TIT8_CAPTE|nr:hypothetical protein CAPTEDRAFT_185833 [Capitella teleta]|eukprot:ELT91456.1 hypothetical protein CAPTEDRAFT_185833 [Capitella teleta]